MSVQVLRAIAALGVVAYHLAAEVGVAGGQFPEWRVGAAGVDLFFVISGFVMVHASRDLFGQPDASAWFLKQRLIRIVPIYWTISAVLLAHALYRYADLPKLDLSWESLVASFFFVPMPRPSGEFSPLLKVGWTLNYEMFFYLIFAATLAFRRTAALLTVLGIIASLAIVSALVWPNAETLSVWPAPIIAEFAFGVLIGWVRLSGFRMSTAVSVAITGLGFAALLSIYLAGIITPRVIVWGLPAAAIVAGAALCVRDVTGPVWRGVAQLGDASYALYLVHTFMGIPRVVMQRLLGTSDGPWIWWSSLYVMSLAALSIVIALLVHRFFEVPVGRRLRAMFATPRAVPKSAGVSAP